MFALPESVSRAVSSCKAEKLAVNQDQRKGSFISAAPEGHKMMKSTRTSRTVKLLTVGRTVTGLALLVTLLLPRPAAALATAEESQGSLQPEGASDLRQVVFFNSDSWQDNND